MFQRHDSFYARLGILTALALLLTFATTTIAADNSYLPDVVIIKLKPTAASRTAQNKSAAYTSVPSLDALCVEHDVENLRRSVPSARPVADGGFDRHGLARYYTIQLPPGSDVEAVVASFAADLNVEYAHPDYLQHIEGVPNDPDYDEQWMHNWVNDKDMDTEEAWGLETGDSSVVIGIIDTGVLWNHPDLKWNVWVNPGEDLDGDGVVMDPDDVNGVDDDLNGYVDDFVGYDFITICTGWPGEDCAVADNDPADFNGHGTHVAGIAAATTDNGLGVAGVAGGWRSEFRPGCKIMCLRAGYHTTEGRGSLPTSALTDAINYATTNGAEIINNSWGGGGSAALLQDAMHNAVSAGLLVYKSAGNDDNEIFDDIDTIPGVISVANLDFVGGKAGTSTYGTWVEISAPGDNIWSTNSNLGSVGYSFKGGTSMASPAVAGVAALLKSHHPWLTAFDIDTIIQNTADDVDADNPPFAGKLGAGRANAFAALSTLSTADFEVDTSWGEAPLTVNFTDISPNAPSGPYEYTFGDGGVALTADASHEYTAPGLYPVTFTASGPSGPHTRVRPEMIVVLRDTVEYGDVELEVGQIGTLDVRVNNSHQIKEITLPFDLVGASNIRIEDVILGSLLTNWTKQKAFDNTFFGQGVWILRAGTSGAPLPAGGGVIAELEVNVVAGTPGAIETVGINTLAGFELECVSAWVTYPPHFTGGEITIPIPPCACDCFGDPACDQLTNVLDVVNAVNVAFKNAADIIDPNPVCPLTSTDVDCSGFTNVIDVVKFVNVAFKNADAAIEFCDPCAP